VRVAAVIIALVVVVGASGVFLRERSESRTLRGLERAQRGVAGPDAELLTPCSRDTGSPPILLCQYQVPGAYPDVRDAKYDTLRAQGVDPFTDNGEDLRWSDTSHEFVLKYSPGGPESVWFDADLKTHPLAPGTAMLIVEVRPL
jgi:hypothetical protein